MNSFKIKCPLCEVSITPSFWARHCESKQHLKAISETPNLTIEIAKETEERSKDKVECPVCKKTFTRDYYEKYHVKTASHERAVKFNLPPSPEEEKMTCPDCGKTFLKKSIYSHRKSEFHKKALLLK